MLLFELYKYQATILHFVATLLLYAQSPRYFCFDKNFLLLKGLLVLLFLEHHWQHYHIQLYILALSIARQAGVNGG